MTSDSDSRWRLRSSAGSLVIENVVKCSMDIRKEYCPFGSAPLLALNEVAELPPLHCGWKLETLRFDHRSISLALPATPDQLLDQPEVQKANSSDDYMPYWAWLWPASIKLADLLLRSQFTAGMSLLDIGSGVGLTGIAAALAGYSVTMSDYDPAAVQVARANARRNLCDASARQLDWRFPPQAKYEMIVGGDVLYERRNIDPILCLSEQCLQENGRCWFADEGRPTAFEFCDAARQRGWTLRIFDEQFQELSAPGSVFQVMELTR